MFDSLYNNFKDVINNTWPMVFVSLIILISLRLTYMYKNKVKFVLYREILLFFFAFYVLCLFQIVTSTDTSLTGGSNYIPFKEIMRYRLFSNLFFKNVVGNVILFLPFGYFISRFVTKKSFFLSLFLILLASVTIEYTQLIIGRVFDVDDIILNVFGGLLGYILYYLSDKFYNSLPKVLKSTWFLNIFFCILFILFFVIIVLLYI